MIRQKTKKRNVKIPNNYLRNESLKSSFNTVVNSSTFKTVISRKVNYAFGNGLFYDEKYKDNLSKYISNLNEIDEIIQNCANNFQTYGSSFILLSIYTDEIDRVKKIGLENLENKYVYVKNDKEEEGTDYFIESHDLSVNKYPYFIEDLDTNKQFCILEVSEIKGLYDTFALPFWVPIRAEMEAEYRINAFIANDFENSFVTSKMMTIIDPNMNPVYSNENDEVDSKNDPTRELITRLTENKFGDANAFKVFVQVVASKEEAVIIQDLSEIKDGHFEELSRRCQNKICGFCGLSLALAGLETGTNIGSNVQLVSQFGIMQSGVIEPLQKKFKNSILYALESELKLISPQFNGIELGFKAVNPISKNQFVDITTVLTQDELRKILGYEPLNQKQDAVQ